MSEQNPIRRATPKRDLKVEDLPRPATEELTSQEAEQARGGIIAILIGMLLPAVQTPNTNVQTPQEPRP